jgi:hypothetical protein
MTATGRPDVMAWVERHLDPPMQLTPWQRQLAEALLRGDAVMVARPVGMAVALQAACAQLEQSARDAAVAFERTAEDVRGVFEQGLAAFTILDEVHRWRPPSRPYAHRVRWRGRRPRR